MWYPGNKNYIPNIPRYVEPPCNTDCNTSCSTYALVSATGPKGPQGATGPTGNCSLKITVSGTGYVLVNDLTDTSSINYSTNFYTNNNGVIINGPLGINTHTPQYDIDINGNMRVTNLNVVQTAEFGDFQGLKVNNGLKLIDFNGYNGNEPYFNIYNQNDGCLYALCYFGGSYYGFDGGFTGFGTVVRMNRDGSNPKVIYEFKDDTIFPGLFGGQYDGYFPLSAVFDSNSQNLYIICQYGGLYNSGTIFAIDTTFVNPPTKIYDFNDIHSGRGGTNQDGCQPNSIVFDTDTMNNLYVALTSGGVYSYGTVFNYNISDNSGQFVYSLLNEYDGSEPYSLVYYSNTLYVASYYGSFSNRGAFFTIDSYSGTIFNSIQMFIQNDSIYGGYPNTVYLDALNNNIYLLMQDGGSNGKGCILSYNLTDINNYIYNPTNIYNASQNDTIYYLYSILYNPTDNYLYVSSLFGGFNKDMNNYYSGNGGVFRIRIDGSQYELLHYFEKQEGAFPGSITTDFENIYIANSAGGIYDNNGSIYKINTVLKESTIYGNINIYNQLLTTDYQTNSLGINNTNPQYNLDVTGNVRITDLNVVQNAQIGDLQGLNVNNGLKLIDFNGKNGFNPYFTIYNERDGFLYTLCNVGGSFFIEYDFEAFGTVVRMNKDGSDAKVIYEFKDDTFFPAFFGGQYDGCFPTSAVFDNNFQNLYIICNYGGLYSCGTIFVIDTTFTNPPIKLYDFNDVSGNDGRYPNAISYDTDTQNNLYIALNQGGQNNNGTIFNYNITDNSSQFVYSLTNDTNMDGTNPVSLVYYSHFIYTVSRYGYLGLDYGSYFIIDRYGDFYDSYAFINDQAIGGYPVKIYKDNENRFYILMTGGGLNGLGCILQTNISLNLTKIYDCNVNDTFSSLTDILYNSNDNFLYVSAQYGGQYHNGGVFRIDTNSDNFEILHYFEFQSGIEPYSITTDYNYIYIANNIGGFYDIYEGAGTIYRININNRETNIYGQLNIYNRLLTTDYQNGYIGINTQNPQYSLDINGSLRVADVIDMPNNIKIQSDFNNASVAIGYCAGLITQGPYSVAIGNAAGLNNQQDNSIAIGIESGYENQGESSVAIGNSAGYSLQGSNSIAIGSVAGNDTQGSLSIAIGCFAGSTNQSGNAIAIGNNAGVNGQGKSSIIIGDSMSFTSIGSDISSNYSIMIGSGKIDNNVTGTFNNSIVLNATTDTVISKTGESQLFINPIRNANKTGNFLYYDQITKEVTNNPDINTNGNAFVGSLNINYGQKIYDVNPTITGNQPNFTIYNQRDGYLYTLNSRGPTYNCGSIFQMDINGENAQLIYEFQDQNESGPEGIFDGGFPINAVFDNSGQNLYVICKYGGLYVCGTLWKFDTLNNIQTKLYDFNDINQGLGYGSQYDGYYPVEIVYDTDTQNNLYIVLSYGGNFGGDSAYGTVYNYILDYPPDSYVIYNFINSNTDGGYPISVEYNSNTLFVVSNFGGSFNSGCFIGINTITDYVTYLFQFNGDTVYGGGPQKLYYDNFNGYLYIINSYGGSQRSGCVLYIDFYLMFGFNIYNAYENDNFYNIKDILYNPTDNYLYLSAQNGGRYGFGGVLKISPDGNSYNSLEIVHYNKPEDGIATISITRVNENIYETNISGGYYGVGTIFKLNTSFHTSTVYGELNIFNKLINTNYVDNALGINNQNPQHTLDVKGDISVTDLIVTNSASFNGDIRGLNVNYGQKIFDTLPTIEVKKDIGYNPVSILMNPNNGLLYVLFQSGGLYNCGSIVKMDNDGNNITIIYNFYDGSNYNSIGTNPIDIYRPDGYNPVVACFDYNYNYLYVACSYGGENNCGTLWKITVYDDFPIKIYDFNDTNPYYEGQQPRSIAYDQYTNQLCIALYDGGEYEYGTVVFLNLENNTTNYVYSLTYESDGSNPSSLAYLNGSFQLYVTAYNGSDYGYGAIFIINTSTYNVTNLSAFPNVESIFGFVGGNPSKIYIDYYDEAIYVILDSYGQNNNGSVFWFNFIQSRTIYYNSQYNTFSGLSDIISNPYDHYLYLSATTGGQHGNSSNMGFNGGGVIRIRPDGSDYQLLHYFESQEGQVPFSITIDYNYLYIANYVGGISNGGPNTYGSIYKINTNFKESNIYGNMNIYNKLITTNYTTSCFGINNQNPIYSLDISGVLSISEYINMPYNIKITSNENANAVITIGNSAGSNASGLCVIAIGNNAGNGVYPFYPATNIGQGNYAVAIGYSAGQYKQGENAIAIGFQAGYIIQGLNSISVGYASNSSGNQGVAIGYYATANSDSAVAIGNGAGQGSEGLGIVAIGTNACSGGNYAIAVGYNAGYTGQGPSSISIGYYANSYTASSIAIGPNSQTGGDNGIAIGNNANSGGVNSIAIGYNVGTNGQGDSSIFIGDNINLSVGYATHNSIIIGSGSVSNSGTGTFYNSIVLNATTETIYDQVGTSQLFINPIRKTTPTSNYLFYNNNTKEVTYSPANSFSGNFGALNVNYGHTIYDFPGEQGNMNYTVYNPTNNLLYVLISQFNMGSVPGSLITMDTNGENIQIVYNFSNDNTTTFDGINPNYAIYDGTQYLYLTCSSGGSYNCGTLWRFDTTIVNLHEKLYDFNDIGNGGAGYAYDGFGPTSITFSNNKYNLYITLNNGGNTGNSYGTIFNCVIDSIVNSGVLYNFTGGVDGYNPTSLFYDSNNLFVICINGTTNKGAFSTFDLGSNSITTQIEFINDIYGGTPWNIYLDPTNNSNFYILSWSGGSTNNGCILSINFTYYFGVIIINTTTNIYNGYEHDTFNYNTAIVKNTIDGFLYVVCCYGGEYQNGGYFRLKPDGSQYQILHHFDILDGVYPSILVTDNIYSYIGSSAGGLNGNGNIYKINTNFQESHIYGNINIYNELITTNYTTGCFGINNQNPLYSLDISGSININGGLIITDYVNGNLNINGNVNATKFYGNFYGEFHIPSDYRIKTNVEKVQVDLEFDTLNPVYYFNTKTNRQDMGFIAHEIQEIYPELVTGVKDGDETQTVNYIGLIPICVKEIQNLKEEILKLKQEIEQLKRT